jgi:hypothetical protein
MNPAFLGSTIKKPTTGGGGGGGGSPLITSGLILYYKFDEGSGTTALDASGNSRNGTLSGTIPPSYVTGYIGTNALSFNGLHSYVDSGVDSAANLGTGNFTAVCWIKTTYGSTEVAIGKNSGVGDKYWLGTSGTAFGSVNGHNITGGSSVSDGNWHHLAMTCNGGTITVYLDGTSVATGSYTGACNPSGNMHVGDWGTSAQFRWNGSLDEVALYNRALSGAEISTLFHQTHP